MAALGRLARWKVADDSRLDDGERYSVAFRFRLDLSLLPRPFQIGMANQPEWVIEVQRRLPVPATVSSPAAPPEAPDERASDNGSAAR